jgi:hypothetical protein
MPTWEELRTGVYEIDGSWRDVYVLDATREDWHHWMTYVNAHYPVIWGAEDHQDGQTLDAIDVAYIERRWDAGAEALTTWGSVFLEQVQLNCHFFTHSQIENDIDPSQLHSLEDHHRLMAYLVAISTALGKEVIVTAENIPEGVYIRVNGPNIHFEE